MSTTYNLASLLETSAQKYPEREAIVFPATGRRMTYAEVDTVANMVANLLRRARASSPATRWRSAAPTCRTSRSSTGGSSRPAPPWSRSTCCSRGARSPTTSATPTRRPTSASRAPPSCRSARRATPGSSRPTAASTSSSITAALDGESPFEGIADLRPGARRAGRRRSTPSRPTRTTPRSSSTPPAPPGSPRAPSSGTATCATTRCSARSSSAPTPSEPDTFLCVLPLFHSFGQTVIQNGAAAYGGTVVMLPRFEAGAALELMRERGHHLLRRRADDVLGAARRARRRPTARSTSRRSSRTCGSPRPAARRCRSRCTRRSSASSA